VLTSSDRINKYLKMLEYKNSHDDKNIKFICNELGLKNINNGNDEEWESVVNALDKGKRAFVQADALYAEGQSHAYCGIGAIGNIEGQEGIICWDPDSAEKINLKLIPRQKIDLMFIEE
jgi:hypothetical protein